MQPGNYGGDQGPYGGPNYGSSGGYPPAGQPPMGQQPGQYRQGQPGQSGQSGFAIPGGYQQQDFSQGYPPYGGQPGQGPEWGAPPQQGGMSGTTKAIIGGLAGLVLIAIVAVIAVVAIQMNKDDDTSSAAGAGDSASAAAEAGPSTYVDGDPTPFDSTLSDLYDSAVYGGEVIDGEHRTSMDTDAASLLRVVFGEEESTNGAVSFESSYGAVDVAEVTSADGDGIVMRAKKADLQDLVDALEDDEDGDWNNLQFGAAGGADDTYYYGAFAVR